MKSDPAIIRNCLQQGNCHQVWADMAPSDFQEITDTHEIRQCEKCGNIVNLAATPEALCRFIELNLCVAIPWVMSKDGQVLPRPEPQKGSLYANFTEEDWRELEKSNADIQQRSNRLLASFIELKLDVVDVPSFMSPALKLSILESKAIEQIQTRLVASHQGAKGYGGQVEAAGLAARFFGIGWAESPPNSADDCSLRLKLRRVLQASAPEEHSNIYVIWQRFQENAKKAYQRP